MTNDPDTDTSQYYTVSQKSKSLDVCW